LTGDLAEQIKGSNLPENFKNTLLAAMEATP
jgi:hypothetical protein